MKQEQWYRNMFLVVGICLIGSVALSVSRMKPPEPLPTPPPAATPSGSPIAVKVVDAITGSSKTKYVSITEGVPMSAGVYLDNGSSDNLSPFPVTCTGAKECYHLIASINGARVFVIRYGDSPQGPGCDFGKLVRLAKQHAVLGPELEQEYVEQLRVCSPKEAK